MSTKKHKFPAAINDNGDSNMDISGPYSEFFLWMEEKRPSEILDRVKSIRGEYGLSVIEGIEGIEGAEAGKRYPEAGKNLRFMYELCDELEFLLTDLQPKESNGK